MSAGRHVTATGRVSRPCSVQSAVSVERPAAGSTSCFLTAEKPVDTNHAAAAAGNKRPNWWTALGLGSVSVMARSLKNQNSGWLEMSGRQQLGDRHSPLNPPEPTEVDQALFQAIDKKCGDQVNSCLDRGANVNAVNGFFGESALHHAARIRWRAGVTLLLNRGALPNIENRFFQTPLHFTAVSGCAECMNTLLSRDKSSALVQDMRGYTPLHDAAVGSDVRCVKLLLEAGADVHVADNQGETPLHKCSKSGFVPNIVALLNEGADLKAKNAEGETALAMLLRNIPNALNRILDHCLVPNKLPKNHKNFELTINFKPLMRDSALSHTYMLRNFIKIGEADVLKHPVCQAFLQLKWRHVVKLFLFKLLFYMAFVLVATIFTLNKFVWDKEISEGRAANYTSVPNNSASSASSASGSLLLAAHLETGFYWTAVSMIVCFIITELVNILSSATNYFADVMAYVNWLLFIMFFTISASSEGNWQTHVAAFFILFLWSKAMHMIGQFPSCGIYVSMFAKVAKVICKIFFVYFSLLIAFSISFHLSFRNVKVFRDPGNAFMKTLTLMIGEVDYDALFIDQTPLLFGTSHFIFFLFLLLISIILSNLLVALAVSDVQGLRQDAHLERLKKQSQLIHETELMRAFVKSLFRCHSLQRIIQRLLQSFHLDLLATRVFILPNHPQKSRYLQILEYRTKNLGEHKVSKDMVDLFWRALQGQENVDLVTGQTQSRSPSGITGAGLARRSTVRHLIDPETALRAHRGREVASPKTVTFEDFRDLVSGMEARLAAQIQRRFDEVCKEVSNDRPARADLSDPEVAEADSDCGSTVDIRL